MGNSLQTIAPSAVLKCDACGDECRSARFDYQCATNGSTRWGMTSLHLVVMVTIFIITLLLYTIFLRVCSRRFDYQLRAMPLKYLPIGRDVISRRMQKQLVEGFSRIVNVSSQPLPAPSPILQSAPTAYGSELLGTANLRVAVVELGRTLCDLIAKVLPEAWENAGGSLRLVAPALVEELHLQHGLVWSLVAALERAEFTDYPFSGDEFMRLQELIFHTMNAMRWSALGAVPTSARPAVSNTAGLTTAR